MARDRYLWNAGEETINNAEAEIKIVTPKQKWQNFCYYHKWHVLIATIACALIVYFIYDIVTKVEPDYQIAMITQSNYPSSVVEALGKELEKYGKDLNGDGQVSVQVNSYVMTFSDSEEELYASQDNTASSGSMTYEDPNVQIASVTRYTVDVQQGESMIFLTDEESFLDQEEQSDLFAYLDGSVPESGATDYENMRIAWSDCKALANFEIENDQMNVSAEAMQELMGGLSLSMRYIENSKLAENPDKVAYYEECREMFERIIDGTPIEQSEETEQGES